MTVTIVAMIVGIALMVLSLAGLALTSRVYRRALWLLEQTSAQAQLDIAAGRPWEWRYELFNAQAIRGQVAMAFTFWRPIQDWLADAEFLRPGPPS